MTDIEKKIDELEREGYIKNDSYEVYATANDGWAIDIYTSSWGYEQWIYTAHGGFIEAWEIACFGDKKKIA